MQETGTINLIHAQKYCAMLLPDGINVWIQPKRVNWTNSELELFTISDLPNTLAFSFCWLQSCPYQVSISQLKVSFIIKIVELIFFKLEEMPTMERSHLTLKSFFI